MAEEGFRRISLRGNARQRGHQHGEWLRDSIREAFAFYAANLFPLASRSLEQIQSFAEGVRKRIDAFEPDYCTELDAIAAGAGMARWQLYAMTARTEIFNAAPPECTALFFEETRALGQNWDWFEPFENWVALFEVECPDGHRFLTLNEPGMLGKLGLNNRGMGLCLNILSWPATVDGVPVHVLTRAILDAAEELLARAGNGQASHFLVADACGGSLSIELGGGRRYRIEPRDGAIVHTNHYLAETVGDPRAGVPTTRERLATACEALEKREGRDLEDLKSVLLDEGSAGTPVCCPYQSQPKFYDQVVGTCATVVMDLPAGLLHVKKGPGREPDFETIAVAG
jgi:isopenicillin-N N-acyltransferase-like protein